MSSENPVSQTNPRKRPITEVDEPTTLICTVVAIDHTNLYYRVCSVCEKTLPEATHKNATINPCSSSASLPICRYCNFKNAFNPGSSGSKRLFKVLVSNSLVQSFVLFLVRIIEKWVLEKMTKKGGIFVLLSFSLEFFGLM